MAKDYYTVLGVPRGASQGEVKQTYRRLAREYHPDVRKDDPQANERFKEINEAYYVLGDPDRRSQYDRFGQVGDMPARDFGRDFGDLFSPFDDLFDMFFGRGARTTARPQQDQAIGGAHLRHDLEISLEEAAHGTEKAITFSRLDTCTVCFGTGRERGSAPETCPTCRGTGELRYQQQTVFGHFTQVVTCRECGGRGTVIRHPCRECGGTGRREAARELTVQVPPGVDSGTRLRIPSEGEGGIHGGIRGDLYVVVHVRPHPVFAREGSDLYCEVPISMVQAALGDEISVPGIDDPTTMAIPPGTQPGTRLRLRGQGMPDLRGGRGDLYVRLGVEIPKDLTSEQHQVLLQLADLRGERVRPQKRSLWKKMKDLLQ
ncbi:MAG: chaperone protein DnaJ, molecular chaperone DnaJ [Armatimonadetes bacterium CSP1-3]|nr:MAG: chaperone protein DnaJ, molecular chaperone DnaJ [Armatimonadetes bacterium CSP1-3]